MAKLLDSSSAVKAAGPARPVIEGQSRQETVARYLPPPHIMKKLVVKHSAGAGRETVTMSLQTFQKLMEAAFSGVLDEAAYLDRNADIRTALKAGAVPSALRHFVTDGYFEGRGRFSYDVDEEWYLKTYPDVAQAIKSGKVKNATHHFEAFGFLEGRVPNPALQQTVAEWRALESKAVP